MATPRWNAQTTALLVVDLQEKLLGRMHNHEQVLERSARLIQGCRNLQVPVLVTEQYPKGLGRTVPGIEEALAAQITSSVSTQVPCLRAEKLRFSACIEPVRLFLAERQIRSVIVCGIEAHVCVMQTCLDLIDAGLSVAAALDAIGSRQRIDHDAAVLRMVQIGVTPVTVESILFEMVMQAGTEQFKAILPVVK